MDAVVSLAAIYTVGRLRLRAGLSCIGSRCAADAHKLSAQNAQPNVVFARVAHRAKPVADQQASWFFKLFRAVALIIIAQVAIVLIANDIQHHPFVVSLSNH